MSNQDQVKDKIIIIEDDYTANEPIVISDDVYNLTIAANMTKSLPPKQIIFCIRQCIMVFWIQITISVLFCYEYRKMDFVQPFNKYHTTLRIIVPVFMAMKFGGELNKALKMFTFLKRQKGSRKHLKGRFINLFLAMCQILGPFVLQTSLIIVISQEPSLGQITKAFVTLGFVVGIDDMFANTLPPGV